MWYLLAGFIGSLVGIVICALCTASRVAEVESRVDALRLQNRWLESLLRRGQGRRANQILGTRHEDAGEIREGQEALAARVKGESLTCQVVIDPLPEGPYEGNLIACGWEPAGKGEE